MRTTTVKYQTKPQAAVQYEIALLSGALMYNPNQSGPIQGRLEWRVYKIEGDQRLPMSNKQEGMACRCGYSDAPGNNPGINTTDNVTFNDDGAAQVAYNSDSTKQFTIVYGSVAGNVFTQLARLDVPVNVIGKDSTPTLSIHLDNQYDTMLCYYHGGNAVLYGNKPVTNIKVMYGGDDVTTKLESNVTATANSASFKGEWLTQNEQYRVNSISATTVVTFSVTYKGQTATAAMTIRLQDGGNKYNIRLSTSTIAYNVSTGAMTDDEVEVEVWMENETGLSHLTSIPQGLKLAYSVDDTREVDISETYKGTYTLAVGSKARKIVFTLSHEQEGVLDTQSVSVVEIENGKNGENGENGKDSPSLQFACPSCIVRLSNDTYGTPVVARSNTANLYLGSTMLTDTYYYFGTMGESFKIGIGEEAKTINYNSWRFSVANSGGTLTFSLIEVQEGAKEAINLPIFAISASTQTQYKEVSYAIARKGDPNVSIDFDNNNATLLYNSSTGKYVNAPVVTNVSVLVGSEDISKKAIVHITTVNLTGTVKRGLNSYSFDEEGIDDEIDGEGIIGIKVTGFFKKDSSVGSIIAHYEYENKMYTATFNVTRSVGRYAVDIIATPTQVSYNQTTGLASSSKVVATINAIDINGVRTENAIFANYGAMRYRYLGETTWRLPNQNTDKLEIEPDFTKRGIEFDFVDASRTQLDYETVPIAAVTNGGDAYLVNVASMNVAVMLSSISYGTSTGDVTNVVYMTKNNAVLSSGMEYNVPGEDGDEHSLTADGQVANDVSYNGWVFNYSYQNGRLTSALVRVDEGSPTSVHIPIDVMYPTEDIARTVMISYTAIQKGPAGRSYKPNTPVLFEEGKIYEWNDQYRDFIYYAFKVNDKGEQDDEKGVLSYFQYGVKEYGMKITDTPPSAKGGDDNWEYISEYKSIIVNCLFGTNAVLGGMVFTADTQTSIKETNGEANIIIDGANGKLTANDAIIRGEVNATAGTFKNVKITNNCWIEPETGDGDGWFMRGGNDRAAAWWLGYNGKLTGQFTMNTVYDNGSNHPPTASLSFKTPNIQGGTSDGLTLISAYSNIDTPLANFSHAKGMMVRICPSEGVGINFINNAGLATPMAFNGAGHGCLNGVIQGYQLNVITSGQIDISKGNTVYCNGGSSNYLVLPTLANCRGVLGTTGAFALDLTIIGASGASNFRVYGKYHDSTTDCYLLNNNHGDNWFATMSQGDVLTLKLIYTGTSFYAYIVNMQN